MGIMACSRRGCENVMCNRYSCLHGFICEECFEELVRSGAEMNVAQFMDTSKKTLHNSEEAARARFNVEFPEDQ